MKKAYILWHIHRPNTEEIDEKFIGVYSSIEKAQEAAERSAQLPGFIDFPDGFSVDAYEIDEDHWKDGFFTQFSDN